MALQKSSIPINFSSGLDLKTDEKQVAPGKFLALANTIFTKGGLLQKRNGYGNLTSLPDLSSTLVSTFNDNLTAIGTSLQAYSQGGEYWVDKGDIHPINLHTLPLIRSSINQSQVDSAIAPNGLICTVYTDDVPSGGTTTPAYKYVIADSVTGQNIVSPTLIQSTMGTTSGSPRVFVLGSNFVIVYTNLIAATYQLDYIAISTVTPTSVRPSANITTQYTPNSTVAWDGAVVNNTLYLAWNGNDGGGAVRVTSLDFTLAQSSTRVFSGFSGNLFSVAGDITGTTPVIYVTFYSSSSTNGYTLAVNQILSTVFAPTLMIPATNVQQLTSIAQNGVNTIFYQVFNTYAYDTTIRTDLVRSRTISMLGVVGTITLVSREIGIASKAFIFNSIIYFLGIYGSAYQPSYFLMDSAGNVVAKLAYSNAGPYLTHGLPSVSINSAGVNIPYLVKDQIVPVNKTQGVANTIGVYAQTGINLVTFIIETNNINTAEIGNNLNITGGFLWMYDGYRPVEQGFHLWPDYVEVTTATTGGALAAQQYYYAVTYEWTDNQGNVFKSAPSVPVGIDLTSVAPTPVTFTSVFSSGDTVLTVSSVVGLMIGQKITDVTTGGNIQPDTVITSVGVSTITISLPTAGASAIAPGDTLQTNQTSSNTLHIPTLRLTYKTANPVSIVIYRWSAGLQVYYKVTSVNAPLLNDTSVDYVDYVDTLADSSILGNSILYTTGGVLENIAPPSTSILTLFQSRLFLVNAEDSNQLWYSKQVIEGTPVEMSDLLTLFVAPTTSAQGSTGPITALSALDDKLIIFKKDAIYYVTGVGPDNTGANNGFSEPIFITSTVGCANPHSIVFMPQGLMFQSDKGIWLLGRDLSTTYIGSPVENYNTNLVQSGVNIPGTNQVRFTLNSGVTLMYDYFFGQWGTFTNVPAISSTLYQGLHTYLNSRGAVLQETPGAYLDASNPVLMSFTTSWFNLAGLQGYERAYYFYILATYLSPHRIQVQIAYDYDNGPSQSSTISPDNYNAPWGGDPLWGSNSPWGGNSNIEQWRVFLQKQKCQAFQLTINELFDPSFGTPAGAGFTMSGIDLVVGAKSGYPRIKQSRSVG